MIIFQIINLGLKDIDHHQDQITNMSNLVTSNFSFSQSVFKRLVSQGRQKVSLCGKELKN